MAAPGINLSPSAQTILPPARPPTAQQCEENVDDVFGIIKENYEIAKSELNSRTTKLNTFQVLSCLVILAVVIGGIAATIFLGICLSPFAVLTGVITLIAAVALPLLACRYKQQLTARLTPEISDWTEQFNNAKAFLEEYEPFMDTTSSLRAELIKRLVAHPKSEVTTLMRTLLKEQASKKDEVERKAAAA